MFLARTRLSSCSNGLIPGQNFGEIKSTEIGKNDVRVLNALVGSGWRVGVVWECALKGKTQRPLNDVVALCSAWFASGNVSLEISGLEYVL